MKKIYIAPSILSCPFYRLESTIKDLENGGADYIHLDVMDGSFVDNITFGSKMASDIKNITNLKLDVHLMTENTERHIDAFAQVGVDIISVHIENNYHVHKLLQKIKQYGIKAGIVLNPHSPVVHIKDILDMLDYVLIMSVNPGAGGQSFIENSLKKIADARDIIDRSGRDILLAVDGGVNSSNVMGIKESGANYIIAGTAILDNDNISEAIKNIRGC